MKRFTAYANVNALTWSATARASLSILDPASAIFLAALITSDEFFSGPFPLWAHKQKTTESAEHASSFLSALMKPRQSLTHPLKPEMESGKKMVESAEISDVNDVLLRMLRMTRDLPDC